jgi:hypothetical protein
MSLVGPTLSGGGRRSILPPVFSLRSSFLRAVRKKGVYMIDRFIWEIAGVLFVATFAVTLTLLS